MRKCFLLFGFILLLVQMSILHAQCTTDAGSDFEICGNSTVLAAFPEIGDYNMFWTSLTANIEFSDSTNPNSNVFYTGNFSDTDIYNAELVWATTNSSGLTCTDTVLVNFKVIPSSEFVIESATCSDTYTGLYYFGINSTPALGITEWIYESPVDVIPGTDSSNFQITAINTGIEPSFYPISLQRTYNNCTSEITSDSLLVVPWTYIGCCTDPIAYAGEDTTICDTIYQLQASLSDTANWGYWVQVAGPIAAFINEDQGSPSEAGNPNATIIIQSPGIACLFWYEKNGDCISEDTLYLTSLDPTTCIPLYSEIETTLPTNTSENDGSISVSTYGGTEPFAFSWIGPNEFISTEQDINNLSIGVYYLEISDLYGHTDFRTIHLTESYDSTTFDYPIDTTFLASQNTCIYYPITEAFIYNYQLLEDSIAIEWAFIGEDLQIQFININYPFYYTQSGAYGFTINIDCANKNTMAESNYYQSIYINPNLAYLINDLSEKASYIFPNPTNDKFYLSSSSNLKLVLTNINGQIIFKKLYDKHSKITELDISDQADGIYILNLVYNNHTEVIKLIKN